MTGNKLVAFIDGDGPEQGIDPATIRVEFGSGSNFAAVTVNSAKFQENQLIVDFVPPTSPTGTFRFSYLGEGGLRDWQGNPVQANSTGIDATRLTYGFNVSGGNTGIVDNVAWPSGLSDEGLYAMLNPGSGGDYDEAVDISVNTVAKTAVLSFAPPPVPFNSSNPAHQALFGQAASQSGPAPLSITVRSSITLNYTGADEATWSSLAGNPPDTAQEFAALETLLLNSNAQVTRGERKYLLTDAAGAVDAEIPVLIFTPNAGPVPIGFLLQTELAALFNGNDSFTAGTGAEKVFVGNGDDVVDASAAAAGTRADLFEGGTGSDTLKIPAGSNPQRIFDVFGREGVEWGPLGAKSRAFGFEKIQNGASTVPLSDIAPANVASAILTLTDGEVTGIRLKGTQEGRSVWIEYETSSSGTPGYHQVDVNANETVPWLTAIQTIQSTAGNAFVSLKALHTSTGTNTGSSATPPANAVRMELGDAFSNVPEFSTPSMPPLALTEGASTSSWVDVSALGIAGQEPRYTYRIDAGSGASGVQASDFPFGVDYGTVYLWNSSETGSRSGNFELRAASDQLTEGTENFTVKLGVTDAITGYFIPFSSLSGTIVDGPAFGEIAASFTASGLSNFTGAPWAPRAAYVLDSLNLGASTVALNVTVEEDGSGEVFVAGTSGAAHTFGRFTRIETGNGDDLLLGSDSRSEILAPGTGMNDVDGGAGPNTTDYLDFARSTMSVNAVLTDGESTATIGYNFNDTVFTNIEGVIGSRESDNVLDASGGGSEGTDPSTRDWILVGGGVSDTLKGGAGDDFLWGGSGDDMLHGGEGNNVFFAGAGTDTMVGGTVTGRDVFVFNLDQGALETASPSSLDKIQRFELSQEFSNLPGKALFARDEFKIEFSESTLRSRLPFSDNASLPSNIRYDAQLQGTTVTITAKWEGNQLGVQLGAFDILTDGAGGFVTTEPTDMSSEDIRGEIVATQTNAFLFSTPGKPMPDAPKLFDTVTRSDYLQSHQTVTSVPPGSANSAVSGPVTSLSGGLFTSRIGEITDSATRAEAVVGGTAADIFVINPTAGDRIVGGRGSDLYELRVSEDASVNPERGHFTILEMGARRADGNQKGNTDVVAIEGVRSFADLDFSRSGPAGLDLRVTYDQFTTNGAGPAASGSFDIYKQYSLSQPHHRIEKFAFGIEGKITDKVFELGVASALTTSATGTGSPSATGTNSSPLGDRLTAKAGVDTILVGHDDRADVFDIRLGGAGTDIHLFGWSSADKIAVDKSVFASPAVAGPDDPFMKKVTLTHAGEEGSDDVIVNLYFHEALNWNDALLIQPAV